ncbi:hypothetical protein VB638_15320 [Dolichospermum sp. UHCC 0684]|jgi:triacylglycerol lipase|uniref:hypothetical protein n=1 Tax=Nostocales TaxID=1161 RepID=UPI00029B7C3D|nr:MULTISPECIES: hypothetical protein [Nostocales]AFW93665.1 hypothetical protein ANA_C10873 [Anabaena sp. 90]MEA5530923.1 hypothetical protein [Dolichospermum sp. UHCC 0684]
MKLSQADVNKFRLLINTLIQTSLEEHRAIKYVERINFGKLPAYISNLHDAEKDNV